MNHELGVVIGKFLPPHRGHQHLIETSLAASQRVAIVVCAKPDDPIPGERRGVWLRELYPAARVLVIDDRYDEQDSRVWAANTVRWLGRAPDVVFTSEDYGERYAALMGARHVLVDRERRVVPVSGTDVRRDPFATWEYLSAPVRAWYARRVCVLGAESTGTTTLARALAAVLHTEWVEEFGREYSLSKARSGDRAWRSDEFTFIAQEQARREKVAARQANRVLVCDTNAFATAIWHRRYMASDSPAVAAIAGAGRCDLYLLTGAEIPFVQDGLRDGEHLRHQMQGWFVEALCAQTVPWHWVRGTPAERLTFALARVRGLFIDSEWEP